MMRVLLLLLLGACSSQIDGNVPGLDRVTYIGDRDPRDVSLAIHVWRSSLQWWTGDLADVSGLEITEEEMPTGLFGIAPPGHITIQTFPLLSSSALAHELTHEHLRRADGDPDDTHAEGAGPWTALHDEMIEDARESMRKAGL